MPDPATTPNAASLAFAEDLYASWLADPGSVSDDWRAWFEGLPDVRRDDRRIGPSFRPRSIFDPAGGNGHAAAAGTDGETAAPGADGDVATLQYRVDQLLRAYRVRGHRIATIDPLERPRPALPELDPAYHRLGDADLDRRFSTSGAAGAPARPLRDILASLRATYCRSIGVQYMHIDDAARRNWLQERMEAGENQLELPRDAQLRILQGLTNAVLFEEFIQKKFLGAKSFSLEGSESLIPLLDLAIERAGEHGVASVVVGMAHRGRLNVLANVLGKEPRRIFREFADADHAQARMRGDVKYHLGWSSTRKTASGAEVALSLCFNPSHLEFVDPIALGRARALQDASAVPEGRACLALVLHGDAAFAGQGAVQETLNLSQLRGYKSGGAIHVIVNNQIGFTTDPEDARSTTYCTDVARMLQCPIFHVNGEDPEAVAQVVKLALDFRREWHGDAVIDLHGYRRRGHNEGDEPSFTQPLMYANIRARQNVRERYADELIRDGRVTREQADAIAEECRARLEAELAASSSEQPPRKAQPAPAWERFRGGADSDTPEVATQVTESELAELLEATARVPDGFTVHPKLAAILERRVEMARGARPLDWAAGEAAALATLAAQGVRVRLSGQDTERGTFSHRHAVLHDVRDGHTWMPLAHVAPGQAPVEIWNSPLSETGVLGFEYGYSLDAPGALVLWEAQFGDFVNAAQVTIDQFLVSAEQKWQQLSGLVLLLPHGFEGQGPEHSSARLERFLQSAVDDNLQVANVTTPAQLFHLLRRQALRPWRKPLVVMTPKSLLRHPRAVSALAELSNGAFQRILPDASPAGAKQRADVTRVLLCSGKIAYELEDEREKLGRADVAILRLEQLAPLHERDLEAALAPYGKDTPVVWVQEEPANMGAWHWLLVRFGARLAGRPFRGVSRPAAASPATGSPASHKLEQQEILDRAFARE